MWTYLLGPILVLMPRRWREQHLSGLPVCWERAAFLSGLIEAAISLPFLLVSYSLFATVFLAYFEIEGVVRALAGLCADEARGSAVLAAAVYLHRRVTRLGAKLELPLIRDEITPGDKTCDMKIGSCRKKTEWKYPFTIRYAGAYFQVIADIFLGAGPRPYVYSLRRLPHGEIAGGLRDYDPEDILIPTGKLERIERW